MAAMTRLSTEIPEHGGLPVPDVTVGAAEAGEIASAPPPQTETKSRTNPALPGRRPAISRYFLRP